MNDGARPPRRYIRTIIINVIEPATAPAIAQFCASFKSFRLIKITGINTKEPAIAPSMSDRPIKIGKRVNLKTRVRDITLNNSGVTIKAGMYVGHIGVEITPKKAIMRIVIGLIDPPHREGSRHTMVEQTTSGATVSIRMTQMIVRFIRMPPLKHMMEPNPPLLHPLLPGVILCAE